MSPCNFVKGRKRSNLKIQRENWKEGAWYEVASGYQGKIEDSTPKVDGVMIRNERDTQQR